MKKTAIVSLVFTAFLAFASTSHAAQKTLNQQVSPPKAAIQSASVVKTPKVLAVDIGKLYSEYDKAKEAQESFSQSIQQAREKIMQLQQEGLSLGQSLEDLQAKANNKAFTAEAQQKFSEEAETKAQEIQQKYIEINQYKQQTDQTLAQRQQSVLNLHMAEIKEAVAKVAKKRGADMVLNSTAAILYADDSYDVTSEALSILNKTQ